MIELNWSVDPDTVDKNNLKALLGSRLNNISGDVGVVLSNDTSARVQWPEGRIAEDSLSSLDWGSLIYHQVSGNVILRKGPFDDVLMKAYHDVDWSGGVLLRHKHGAIENDVAEIAKFLENAEPNNEYFLINTSKISTTKFVRFFVSGCRVVAAAHAEDAGPYVEDDPSQYKEIVRRLRLQEEKVYFVDAMIRGNLLVHWRHNSIDTSWEGFDPNQIIRSTDICVERRTRMRKEITPAICMIAVKGLDNRYEVDIDPVMMLGSSVVPSSHPYILYDNCKLGQHRRFATVKKLMNCVSAL